MTLLALSPSEDDSTASWRLLDPSVITPLPCILFYSILRPLLATLLPSWLADFAATPQGVAHVLVKSWFATPLPCTFQCFV